MLENVRNLKYLQQVKIIAQRNQKHIQIGEYLLPVCPEYFRLPIAVRKHGYTYNTAFLPVIYVLV
jgi:hypothetical protein